MATSTNISSLGVSSIFILIYSEWLNAHLFGAKAYALADLHMCYLKVEIVEVRDKAIKLRAIAGEGATDSYLWMPKAAFKVSDDGKFFENKRWFRSDARQERVFLKYGYTLDGNMYNTEESGNKKLNCEI